VWLQVSDQTAKARAEAKLAKMITAQLVINRLVPAAAKPVGISFGIHLKLCINNCCLTIAQASRGAPLTAAGMMGLEVWQRLKSLTYLTNKGPAAASMLSWMGKWKGGTGICWPCAASHITPVAHIVSSSHPGVRCKQSH